MAGPRLYGKYRGIALDDVDPLRRGRVRVIVPGVAGELPLWAERSLALPNGLVAPPEVPAGSPVWIEFEQGDSGLPILSGFRWADTPEPLADP